MTSANRGEIYWVNFGGDKARHAYIVVSYNGRNSRLRTVLGVMITSKDKSHVPTAVPLTHDDHPFVGYAMADHIDELEAHHVSNAPDGYLSRKTMIALNDALKQALGLR